MNKKEIGYIVFTLCFFAFGIFAARQHLSRKADTVISTHESEEQRSVGRAGSQQEKQDPAEPLINNETATIESLADEFAIPADIRSELIEAAGNGTAEADWEESEISREDLSEARLGFSNLAGSGLERRAANVSAGYSLTEEGFAQLYEASLPTSDTDSEEEKGLKSDALTMLGVSAALSQESEKAESALRAVIDQYPDTEAAPVARLELSRMLAEEGRVDEAQQLLTEGITLHRDDPEYVEIAESLREEIESNE